MDDIFFGGDDVMNGSLTTLTLVGTKCSGEKMMPIGKVMIMQQRVPLLLLCVDTVGVTVAVGSLPLLVLCASLLSLKSYLSKVFTPRAVVIARWILFIGGQFLLKMWAGSIRIVATYFRI